jgi:BlaI family transcriptional regulator, penicillinase repressor
MKEKSWPELSRAEYEILRVLWKRGLSSVREVHEHLHTVQGWAYTTTKTMMDRMANKKLLQREDFHGIFLYSPLITRPQGLARLIDFFANRVLEIDAGTVLSLFTDSKAITPEEIKELEKILKSRKGENAK